MKLIRLKLITALVLCVYLGHSQGHEITFQVKGLQDSVMVVGYFMGSQKYVHDTLSVVKGTFTLQGNEDLKPGLYFAYSSGFYYEFIVKEQSFAISTRRDAPYSEAKVQGSTENELFKDFQMKMIGFRTGEIQLNKELPGNSIEDSVRIVSQIREIQEEKASIRRELIEENPGTFISKFLLLMDEIDVPEFDDIQDDQDRKLKRYQYYKSHYFDHVDLSEPTLIRTPLLHQKVMKYFESVIPQHPDSINNEIDKLFVAIGDSKEAFRYWLISLYKKYSESKVMGIDKVTVHLMENYLLSERADWLDEESVKKIREEVAFTKPNLIGNKAPGLELVDTLMQPFYFEQLNDPFLLLYFFDPDCGHCKKKTPVLVDAYPELLDLGVEVVAVCTTTDVERWKEYIKETGMEFINLADPGYESHFRVSYDLRSTPKIYLLDAQRKIIAKQLEIDDLIGFVKHYSNP